MYSIINIVIADNDKNIRSELIRIIEGRHEEFKIVGEATNGEEALEIIKKLESDILITDLSIPVINGMELIRKVKESYMGMKVIVISELDNYKYVRGALTGGAVDYLLKPVNEEELYGTLNKVKENIETKKMKSIKYRKANKVIERAELYINEHYNRDISLKLVADHVFLNANYFSTLFKEEVGEGFIEYLIHTRIGVAKKLLNQPGVKIYEVARAVGYEESASFNRVFKKNVGVTPREYVNSPINNHQ